MTNSIYDSEIHYPKGTPFTYLIGWTESDKFYYGVRFRKNCHPDDLWSKYFTSSTYVEEFRKLNGEPDLIKVDYIFDTAKEATAYEYQFIKENNCVRDSKWLNLCNGGEDFCNLECSEEAKKKMSDAKKGKTQSAEHIKNAADARRGKKRNPHTEEQKQKNSESHKGKKQKPRSAEARKNIGDAQRGRPKSEEHRQKNSDSHKGLTLSPESIQKRTETQKRNRLAKLQTLENCF